MRFEDLPTLNATLNGLSAVFLIAGFIFIRRKRISAHKFCMLSACVTSTLFLICYLTYHSSHGATRYQHRGLIRTVYFSILVSHTFLAVIILPMVIMTLRRALKGNFEAHRRIAKWTLPLWIYVSITGVVIYLMLYQF